MNLRLPDAAVLHRLELLRFIGPLDPIHLYLLILFCLGKLPFLVEAKLELHCFAQPLNRADERVVVALEPNSP
jgi:hypothetical protein